MKLARYLHEGHIRFGIIEGDVLHELERTPFSGIERHGRTCRLDEVELLQSSERFDELVCADPDLRVDDLDRCADQVWAMLSRFDPERGPLPGFEQAMEALCAACLTPRAIHRLRSRLYTVAACVADERPDLLPTVAIASLSLKGPDLSGNAFVGMVLYASAVEWMILWGLSDDAGGPDLSAWLAVEPSEPLIAAVGESQARYYAPIAGIFPLLDPERVLFAARQLAPYACAHLTPSDRPDGHLLSRLAGQAYLARLCQEIRRVQRTLRHREITGSPLDVELLAQRALESLEVLPPSVNPLLQIILAQSWLRYLLQTCEGGALPA